MDLVLVDRPRLNVARLAINRPEARNAMNAELRAALFDALDTALADSAIRAVILTGSERAFSAGGDIGTMAGLDSISGRARLRGGHKLVRLLANAEKPVIAAVHGWAMGAGAGLAVVCDTLIMGRSARIGFPFFRLGVAPDYGLAATLAQRVGFSRARQLLLYARQVPAEEALAIGLADEVVDDAAVADAALARADELAAQPAFALALTKRLFAQQPASLEALLELEALTQALCFQTSEFEEGYKAFMEKRTPRFD